jgi:hypothetical protein
MVLQQPQEAPCGISCDDISIVMAAIDFCYPACDSIRLQIAAAAKGQGRRLLTLRHAALCRSSSMHVLLQLLHELLAVASAAAHPAETQLLTTEFIAGVQCLPFAAS